jgi:hypothetical protein
VSVPSLKRTSDWPLALLVVLATAVVSTWPLATNPWLVPQHQDPLFSSWRLYQWARTLAGESSGLFDGNIFHGARNVQLLSDPIVLPSFIAAPALWMGVPVALVYSALFWLSALGAGLGAFACARALSGSRWGALVAAAMFTGSPVRLEHVVHLESLWTMFLPLAVLATIRVFDGSRRAHWALAASLPAQFLGSIYYGVFLMTLWPLLVLAEWVRRRGDVPRVALGRLVVGLVVAGMVVGAYASAFERVRSQVGDRGDDEVASYSATAASFVTAPASSRVWGWTSTGKSETNLLPGLVGPTLALAALGTASAPWVGALTAVTIVAADAARGLNGWTYPVLRRWSAYRGLRVPARFGMIVLLGLSLLAAVGCATLARWWGRRSGAAAVAAAVLALVVAESSAHVPVRRLPSAAPPVYQLLSTIPDTVIAHVPMPTLSTLPGPEPEYQYFAQYHRHRLVNGYSGFYPPSYADLLERSSAFPDVRSFRALRGAGVEYLLVHEGFYPTPAAFSGVVEVLEQREDVEPVAVSRDEGGAVRVYRLKR